MEAKEAATRARTPDEARYNLSRLGLLMARRENDPEDQPDEEDVALALALGAIGDGLIGVWEELRAIRAGAPPLERPPSA